MTINNASTFEVTTVTRKFTSISPHNSESRAPLSPRCANGTLQVNGTNGHTLTTCVRSSPGRLDGLIVMDKSLIATTIVSDDEERVDEPLMNGCAAIVESNTHSVTPVTIAAPPIIKKRLCERRSDMSVRFSASKGINAH